MKKIIAIILAFAMLFAMVGCGKSDSSEKTDPQEDAAVSQDSGMTTDDAITEGDENSEVSGDTVTEATKPNANQNSGTNAGNPTGNKPGGSTGSTADSTTTANTVGAALLKDFQDRIAKNAAMTSQDMASALLTNSIVSFKGTTMAVQEGLLTGFSTEIKGFDSGVMFAPMIGSIPFVGYIFTVPAGGDVKAFTDTLKNNANPRWNVCTEADETVVQSSGNTVFFLMCPKSLEE